jgi:hypothetical protein
LVDLGPKQITAAVNRYQEDFRARPKVQALYAVAAPYQRSVVDRFATVAAACRMGIEAGLLWKDADTDADIEACVTRWARHKKMDTVVAAIAHFMGERQSWQGIASELVDQLNGAIDSARALGWWLKKSENLRRLKLSGFEVRKGKSKDRNRSRLIRIKRGRLDVSDSVLATNASQTTEVRPTHHVERKRRHNRRHTGRHKRCDMGRHHMGRHKRRHMGRHKVRPKCPNVRKRNNRRKSRHG